MSSTHRIVHHGNSNKKIKFLYVKRKANVMRSPDYIDCRYTTGRQDVNG